MAKNGALLEYLGDIREYFYYRNMRGRVKQLVYIESNCVYNIVCSA